MSIEFTELKIFIPSQSGLLVCVCQQLRNVQAKHRPLLSNS